MIADFTAGLGNRRFERYGKTNRRSKLRRMPPSDRIDFAAVNQAAMMALPSLLARWLPRGRVENCEYVALNPRRVDNHLGSFRINTLTGQWADFAVEGAKGGDPIALAAYLSGCTQHEAARRLAAMLGIEACDAR